MINAVLVFNNNGQPRLTKFYTQLVQFPMDCPDHTDHTDHRPRTLPHSSHFYHRYLPSSPLVRHPRVIFYHSPLFWPRMERACRRMLRLKSLTDIMQHYTSS